jgi:hypothetical protein
MLRAASRSNFHELIICRGLRQQKNQVRVHKAPRPPLRRDASSAHPSGCLGDLFLLKRTQPKHRQILSGRTAAEGLTRSLSSTFVHQALLLRPIHSNLSGASAPLVSPGGYLPAKRDCATILATTWLGNHAYELVGAATFPRGWTTHHFAEGCDHAGSNERGRKYSVLDNHRKSSHAAGSVAR